MTGLSARWNLIRNGFQRCADGIWQKPVEFDYGLAGTGSIRVEILRSTDQGQMLRSITKRKLNATTRNSIPNARS